MRDNTKNAGKSRPGQRSTPKRETSGRGKQKNASPFQTFWRKNAGFVFLAILAVGVGVALFWGYQSVTASSVFEVERVDITGTRRASKTAIERLVRGTTKRTGVWNANLERLRGELEKLQWVKTASVSRVLPDAVRVRIVERSPAAVVRLDGGKISWVDEDGRVLGVVLPEEAAPPFVMLGFDENASDTAQRVNRERIRLYLALIEEWRRANLAERVSAVDLTDTANAVAYLAANGQVVPAHLGREETGKRLKNCLTVFDRYAETGDLAEVKRLSMSGEHVSIELTGGKERNS